MARLLRIFTAPFEVMRTGHFMGVEFERHPIAWIPFCLALVVVIPFLIVATLFLPLLGLLQGFGLWRFSKVANRVRFQEEGLEIFNKKNSIERLIPWGCIASAEKIFDPPLVYVDLILKDDERVAIYFMAEDLFADELERRQIPFDRASIEQGRPSRDGST